jgi:calcineurin-like phosphoesterase family protein
MRTWARSHYNSWQLYGHSHGKLEPIGKQWDIGVDNNNYYPVSFDQITEIMKTRPDNPNLIKRRK